MKRKQRYIPQIKPTTIRPLSALNESQKIFLRCLSESTITFGLGPAGTGKTYIASFFALSELLNGNIKKVIITRPMVATEDAGFLPGTAEEKIAPYLMPLFDAIDEHLGPKKAKEFLDDRIIEILPLAFMRGKSLKDCIIILDESQNCTYEQLKMFLTRLGKDTRMIITGDVSQTDLRGDVNALHSVSTKLRDSSEEISIFEFSSKDIVRHPLIETILEKLNS